MKTKKLAGGDLLTIGPADSCTAAGEAKVGYKLAGSFASAPAAVGFAKRNASGRRLLVIAFPSGRAYAYFKDQTP